MHQYLSRAISRLPVLEANTILRVPGHLPGLHPQHLQCFAGWSTVLARVSNVIDRRLPRFDICVGLLSQGALFRCDSTPALQNPQMYTSGQFAKTIPKDRATATSNHECAA
jgi:hypothetical protein